MYVWLHVPCSQVPQPRGGCVGNRLQKEQPWQRRPPPPERRRHAGPGAQSTGGFVGNRLRRKANKKKKKKNSEEKLPWQRRPPPPGLRLHAGLGAQTEVMICRSHLGSGVHHYLNFVHMQDQVPQPWKGFVGNRLRRKAALAAASTTTWTSSTCRTRCPNRGNDL